MGEAEKPGKRRVKPRYFVTKPSGHYWLPGPSARALGFFNEALGPDLAIAVAKAEKRNAELDRSRLGQDVAPQLQGDTVAFYLREYQKDEDAFLAKAPKTQRGYLQCARRIEEWAGDKHPRAITRKAAKVWYKAIRGRTPAMANAIIRFLRLWLAWCVSEGVVERNVMEKPRLKGRPPRDVIWTDEQIDAFCRMAVTEGKASLELAVLLGDNLAQREGDIIRLPRSVYVAGEFRFRQAKTEEPVSIPASERLQEALNRHPPAGTLFVVNERTGAPYEETEFRHEFARIRGLAGLPKALQYRDLRRTGVVNLGRAGCTAIEIANVSGHSYATVTTILEVYLPRDSTIARAAIEKLDAWRKKKREQKSET